MDQQIFTLRVISAWRLGGRKGPPCWNLWGQKAVSKSFQGHHLFRHESRRSGAMKVMFLAFKTRPCPTTTWTLQSTRMSHMTRQHPLTVVPLLRGPLCCICNHDDARNYPEFQILSDNRNYPKSMMSEMSWNAASSNHSIFQTAYLSVHGSSLWHFLEILRDLLFFPGATGLSHPRGPKVAQLAPRTLPCFRRLLWAWGALILCLDADWKVSGCKVK